MNILDNLKNIEDKLTPAMLKVAKYIIENPHEITYLTVTELAKKSNSSLATVLRLVNKLGYKNFGEFKMALTLNVHYENNNLSDSLDKHDTITQTTQIINSINLNLSKESWMQTLNKSVDLLQNAKRVIIIGYGVSYAVAYLLHFKLTKISINSTLATNIYESDLLCKYTGKDDVLIAITGRGSSTNILESCELAKTNQTPIITVTNAENSPMSNLSDHILYAGLVDLQSESGSIHSRVAMLLIIDVLLTELLKRNPHLHQLDIDSNIHLSKKEF